MGQYLFVCIQFYHIVGELEQGDHGIVSWREDENERRDAQRVAVGLGQVERRRLDVLLAEVLLHKVLHHGHDLVGPNAAYDEYALEGLQLVPLARELLQVRLAAVVHDLPLVLLRQELLAYLFVGVQAVQAAYLVPRLDRQPGGRIRVRVVEADAARQQEAPLLLVDLLLVLHQVDAQQEGEQELVLLEQRAANVAVERVGEVLAQVLQPLGQVLALLRVVDGQYEQVDEPHERVLVHGLDVGQIGDAEEQNGRVDGDGPVAQARLVYLVLGLFGYGLFSIHSFRSPARSRSSIYRTDMYIYIYLFLRNLVRELLGRRKNLNGRLVLEDVALRRGQHFQNFVLDLFQLSVKIVKDR